MAPRSASRMEIVLEGMPAGFALPSDGGQTCSGPRCVIDRTAPLAQGDPARYLKATLAAPSNLGEIRDLAVKISGTGGSEAEKIDRILAWMDDNIAKEAIDSFTAIDVLRERRAECQGHAYLFAALARASGIPARIVNGIVYSAEHGGFLYHTWNEAWIAGRGWQPVDATFGQAHADATHLKLIEGEQPGDLLPLVALVGRIKIASVNARQ
jgi:transglutaminase-like putative cysteine protease